MKARMAMQSNTNVVIVANTFTRQREMEPYREMARQMGHQVEEITVDSKLDDQALKDRNIHNVPLETISAMRQRWEPS